MARYIYINFLMLFVFITPAFAGFEWIPPAENSTSLAPQQQMAPQNFEKPPMDMLPAFPAPAVSALPIPVEPGLTPMPYSAAAAPMVLNNNRVVSSPPVAPSRQSYASVQRAPVAQNVSGKKLVINPYPLRAGNELPSQRTIKQAYRALNEEAGLLNPVQLGNGISTGVRKRSASQPARMTPMMGDKPTSLSSHGNVQAPSQNYAEAVGFGRDLPLDLALSQIIPSDYTHNLSKDVDESISVSWEGGKSWDQVLDDMLKPKNLMAVIRDKRVIIQPLAHI